jgi:hypothetical protein
MHAFLNTPTLKKCGLKEAHVYFRSNTLKHGHSIFVAFGCVHWKVEVYARALILELVLYRQQLIRGKESGCLANWLRQGTR